MGSPNGFSPLRRLFILIKADKKDITRIYVFAALSGLINLSLPLGIQFSITYISVGMISTSWILLVILVVAGVILAGVMQVMQLSLTETIQQRIFQRSSFEFALRIPRALVKEALQRNTCDNLTVVVVCFSPDPPPKIEIPRSYKRRSISAEGLDLLKGVLNNE